MTTISAPKNYSLTFSDDISFALPDTSSSVTLDSVGHGTNAVGNSHNNISVSTNNITIANSGSGYASGAIISTSQIDFSSIWGAVNEEWTDSFPDWKRVNEMCKEYPGLAIAFEKFKTVYKLVTDEYETKLESHKQL
jgi:hypothetical protein